MYLKPLNSIIRSLQKKRFGRLFYYPTKISIEPGNLCNLRCPLCPTNDPEEKYVRKGMMSFENFRIIFDKIRPFVKTLDLFNWGEPFLNKDIGKMIRYAKDKKPEIRLFIDSNFNIVSDDQLDEIVRCGLDVLKISCDGVTQKVYEKYRIGGDVDVVMSNVRKLMIKKEELNRAKPRIIWKYLVFAHNKHEVEIARKTAEEMGIDFEASGMRINCGKEIFENIDESLKRDKKWIPEGTEYDNYKDLSAGRKTCGKPWSTITVDWNGNVVPCGAVYDCEKFNYGNLIKQSFEEIWNGKKYVSARNIINGKPAAEDGLICEICKSNGFQFF